jgi:glyoxylase-like metal-dependent hydrolase (beta-lactamase superfamily II)/rhodanese-related sulfurtransferase
MHLPLTTQPQPVSSTAGAGVEVIAIETPALGDRSYLAHDGSVAVVVDPQRDIDRVLALAAARGVRITHVFETHLHNDYVTGGLALARLTGAAYHVNAADAVAFDRVPVRDGDLIEISPVMSVRVLATPGHTFTHVSYVLQAEGHQHAVFTGGSLLYGSTGRPDLLGTAHARELAGAQYASARRLAAELPEDTDIYPTHGFGSFCSASQTEGTSSTIGRERAVNPVLTLEEDSYIEQTLAGLDAYPAYYAHMGPANADGPAGPDLTPPRRAEAAELRKRIEAGEWVVDLRARRAFAAGHLAGTLSFDLDGGFATYLGWLIPWDTPLTLLGQTPEQVAEAQRELVRIGIDRPQAAAHGGPEAWAAGQPLRSYPVADFADLAAVRHHRPVVVLDVRRDSEWDAAHIDGAVHVPLHDLPARIGELPGGELWVHCQGGYRASVAASFLDAAGLAVVSIDDSFDRAAAAGLPVVTEAMAQAGVRG